ncbi:MAG: ribosome silencing factor [Pyrinomonadaceae bacterium]
MKQNETTLEESALTTEKRAELNEQPDATGAAPIANAAANNNNNLDGRMEAALRAASDKKAVDLVVLDLRTIANFTDYFLIASGTNVRQVQAIADEITERLKREGTRAERIEGYRTAEWVLVDYGDFIVHIFEEKARRFYDLERLWREAARVKLPADLQREANSFLRNEA